MSNGHLKSLADRIEKLMDERDGIQSDIRDIYTEAKSNGFVPKVLRKAITRKRMDAGKRDEEDAILELYEGALTGPMRHAVNMANRGATARQIEAETGIDHATVARSVALNKKSATKTETADGNPPSGGEGTADQPDGPGIASATHSEVAPNEDARAAQSLPLPDADGVSRAGTLSEAETGSATRSGERCGADESLFEPGLMGAAPARLFPPPAEAPPQPLVDSTDAARLRAQIPLSTDPERLEREADRASFAVSMTSPPLPPSAGDDPWESALASKARIDALKAARGVARQGEHRGCSAAKEGTQ